VRHNKRDQEKERGRERVCETQQERSRQREIGQEQETEGKKERNMMIKIKTVS
jgi:hypothetical protein